MRVIIVLSCIVSVVFAVPPVKGGSGTGPFKRTCDAWPTNCRQVSGTWESVPSCGLVSFDDFANAPGQALTYVPNGVSGGVYECCPYTLPCDPSATITIDSSTTSPSVTYTYTAGQWGTCTWCANTGASAFDGDTGYGSGHHFFNSPSLTGGDYMKFQIGSLTNKDTWYQLCSIDIWPGNADQSYKWGNRLEGTLFLGDADCSFTAGSNVADYDILGQVGISNPPLGGSSLSGQSTSANVPNGVYTWNTYPLNTNKAYACYVIYQSTQELNVIEVRFKAQPQRPSAVDRCVTVPWQGPTSKRGENAERYDTLNVAHGGGTVNVPVHQHCSKRTDSQLDSQRACDQWTGATIRSGFSIHDTDTSAIYNKVLSGFSDLFCFPVNTTWYTQADHDPRWFCGSRGAIYCENNKGSQTDFVLDGSCKVSGSVDTRYFSEWLCGYFQHWTDTVDKTQGLYKIVISGNLNKNDRLDKNAAAVFSHAQPDSYAHDHLVSNTGLAYKSLPANCYYGPGYKRFVDNSPVEQMFQEGKTIRRDVI